MPPDLTVIVPCYNEAGRLGEFFALIEANLERNWEWLFVDDGSRDKTAELVEDFCRLAPEKARLHRLERNCGKGRAVREGIMQAAGKAIGYVDADLAASPLEFERFLDDEEVLAGRELVVGIRIKTQDGNVQRYLYRHLMGRAFQTYASVATGLTVYDTQCGFKLMAREAAQQIAPLMITDGFAFDVELILLAHILGLGIREEMISWQEKGDSRIRPSHVLRMALDILKIRQHANDIRRSRQ